MSHAASGEFYDAIQVYEKILAKQAKKGGKVDTAAHYLLAENYRKINQLKKAEPHYAVASTNPKYLDAIFSLCAGA